MNINKQQTTIALPLVLSAAIIGAVSFSEWTQERVQVNHSHGSVPQKYTPSINQVTQNVVSSFDEIMLHQEELSSEQRINTLLEQNRSLRDRIILMPEFQQYFRWKHSETENSFILWRILDIQKMEEIFQKDPAFFEYFRWLRDYQKYLDGDSLVDIFRIQAIQKVYQAMIQYPPEIYAVSVAQPWWNDIHPADQLRKIHSNRMYLDFMEKYVGLNWVLEKYNLSIITIESEDFSGSKYEWPIASEPTDEMIESHTPADAFMLIVDIQRELQDDTQLLYIIDPSMIQSFRAGSLSYRDLWKLRELISKIHISQE